MLQKLILKEFKTFDDVTIKFTRFNVFIGGNGTGKSNLLEAIAIYGAIEDNKNDNVSLSVRGVRIAERSSFLSEIGKSYMPLIGVMYKTRFSIGFLGLEGMDEKTGKIKYNFASCYSENNKVVLLNPVVDAHEVMGKSTAFKKHVEDEKQDQLIELDDALAEIKHINNTVMNLFLNKKNDLDYSLIERLVEKSNAMIYSTAHSKNNSRVRENAKDLLELSDFVIFSPEVSSLRNFDSEGQILPVGSKGDGLIRYLSVVIDERKSSPNNEDFYFVDDILELISILNWIDIDDDQKCLMKIDGDSKKFLVRDRFMNSDLDFRYANEGFLFILFYATIFCSPDTPKIFAVDNIDVALNPMICKELISRLFELSVKYDKQVFLTTHNPAILDGIDIKNEDQSLFVVKRGVEGCTVVNNVTIDSFPENLLKNNNFNRLSEAFIRGHITDALQDF